ncbi:MAG: hypothetical protein DHS20C18_55370 [Saprospiraceae bacterium]|nr:MAG: hypothetical protein DHS20C18_55370 [Saprospiraceae bacterium]
MKKFFTPLILLACLNTLFAQPPCPDGELSLIVEVLTDTYGSETGWSVSGASGTEYFSVEPGTYSNQTLYQTQVCVPVDECITFTIIDTYGDGIFQPGYYSITLEGEELGSGWNFTQAETIQFNCAPGQACNTAMPIDTGIYTTIYDDSWYVFTAPEVGIYEISTCGFTDCDSKIWVYSTCPPNRAPEDNAETVLFDDNDSECAPQAMVTAFMAEGDTYYIRIGDNMDACEEDFQWSIQYMGEISGCTDPSSCNYNPLATIEDGSCIPYGDPGCPGGPDLLVREDVLISSLFLDTENSNDPCLIEEQCMAGYGLRQVLKFSTRIENIGEEDYFIGQPSSDPGGIQFTWNNCHNHWHYDGYAEYLLFDSEGNRVPAGFKNGFCVLDLGCMWGSAQYGCSVMGISAGCYDEYWSGLSCQWIDVTDVPDGNYTFVTRVNWANDPDALGRYEKDTLNNWAQACIVLDRSNGELQFSLADDCEPYVDCAGTAYGNMQMDCNGECGGTSVRGDLDVNGIQEMIDAETYIPMILAQDIEASDCNDLNADGTISVYDAALLASCLNYGAYHNHVGQAIHDHCNFPSGVDNQMDTVSLSIIGADFDAGYIDIGMKNPKNFVNAYQFQMSGLTVMNVENLVDMEQYPMTPQANIDQAMIIGLSVEDSIILKSEAFQPLCRIHYLEITDEFICIDNIVDIVNANTERVVPIIEGECLQIVVNGTTNLSSTIAVKVQPNPFSQETLLTFSNPGAREFQLEITDLNGRVIRTYQDIHNGEVRIERQGLPAGIYLYRLRGDQALATGKLNVQ